MKIGQTTVVFFFGRIASSVIGLLATIYFTRLLGAELWGIYTVAIAVVGWVKLGGRMGVGVAVQKRMSENKDPKKYFSAGLVIVAIFSLISISILLILNGYIDTYIGANVSHLIATLLLVNILYDMILSGLKGQRRVHIVGLLKPSGEIISTITQLVLIVPFLFGLGVVGLLIGKAVGLLLATLFGIAVLGISFRRPSFEHIQSLISFAKYSWLGRFESKTFKEADIIIMGFFVSTKLIGIYSIAWGIAIFLNLFSSSITQTLFPEISNASFNEQRDYLPLIEDGVAYQGLILIPGLVGGTILAEPLLRVYSEEFVQGTAVLWILILSVLVKGYLQQFSVALQAINRPDISFKINSVFILTNIILNIVLIYLYSWVGAAIATAVSAGIGLVLSYFAVKHLTEFSMPVRSIAEQWFAAFIMGIIIHVGYSLEQTYNIINWNILVVIIFVFLGAGIYFGILLVISNKFRQTIRHNLPIERLPI